MHVNGMLKAHIFALVCLEQSVLWLVKPDYRFTFGFYVFAISGVVGLKDDTPGISMKVAH